MNIPSLIPVLHTSSSHSITRLSAVPVVFGFSSCLCLQNASRGFRARRPGPAGTAPEPEVGGVVGGPTGQTAALQRPLPADESSPPPPSIPSHTGRAAGSRQACDVTKQKQTNSLKQSQLSVPDAAVLHHRTYLANTTQRRFFSEPPRKLADQSNTRAQRL